MSQIDPFVKMQEEVSSKLSSIEQKTKEYRTIASSNQASSAEWLQAQISNSIEEVNEHLKLLKSTITQIETNPSRFNITVNELASRKAFVTQIEQRLKLVNDQIRTDYSSAKPKKTKTNLQRANENDNQRFIDREIAQQQMEMDNDIYTDQLVEKTTIMKVQAKNVGNALEESNTRLKEIDNHMDKTQEKLDKANQKMKEILTNKNTWLWIGCGILTIIVVVLLIWVFLGKK